MKKLEQLLKEEKPTKIISVGDAVSDSLVKHGFSPHVLIVDNKIMRKPITPISVGAKKVLHVKNPAGTLTDETWLVVEAALNETQRTKVIVDGEEDLLTLVAVLTAPNDALVIYGQPHEGIVVVKVSESKKKALRKIVNAMKELSPRKTKLGDIH